MVCLGEIAAAAGGVKDAVGGDLVQLDSIQRPAAVDAAQQMQNGRVVGLWVLGEDGEADAEQIDLRGKVVGAAGGDNGLAKLAQGGQDHGEVAGCGRKRGGGRRCGHDGDGRGRAGRG